MMEFLRWVVVPSIVAVLVTIALGLACRWTWRISRPLGALVAIGLTLRLLAGWGLFWVSYLQLPPLRSLQLGQGFWTLALDAIKFHAMAVHAAEDGISTLPSVTGSRAYIHALTLWSQMAGTSPFSAVLLNGVCFVATCALVVAIVRRMPKPAFERAGASIIAPMAFSPMLLFVSTQVLKDAFFMLFAMLLTTGAWLLAWRLQQRSTASLRQLAPGVLFVIVGVFVTAGVRTYYPAFAMGGLGLLLATLLLGRSRAPIGRIAATGAVTLGLSLAGLLVGADDRLVADQIVGILFAPRQAVVQAQQRREGFVTSGGATNIAQADAPLILERRANQEARNRALRSATSSAGRRPSTSGDTERATQPPPLPLLAPTPGDRLRAAAIGLGTIFVPVTLLRALSVVDISGGSAMVAFGDLDTVFFDLSLLATGLVVLRLRRESSPNLPYLVFALAMGLLLAGLMAYVVTNVGTIVRLRLLLTVPLWTLPFAFAPPPLTRDAAAGEASVALAADVSAARPRPPA